MPCDPQKDIKYHENRKKKRAFKYRLQRRTQEVLRTIRAYKPSVGSLLDIGTADGEMLNILDTYLDIPLPVGLDISMSLLRFNKNSKLHLVSSDASILPFKERTFDVVTATAVIEHVQDAGAMLKECYRVLCGGGGICIITTPNPFFENIASRIESGYLSAQKTFSIAELQSLLESCGFEILKSDRFMMSPVGFPWETKIERLMKRLGLGPVLLNQLVVAKKSKC
jgi:ubiquinone/menaquinone biosynthesis C-methylase UbiE